MHIGAIQSETLSVENQHIVEISRFSSVPMSQVTYRLNPRFTAHDDYLSGTDRARESMVSVEVHVTVQHNCPSFVIVSWLTQVEALDALDTR